MGNLYRPGRNFWQAARGSQPPLWPFTINRDSPQAEGLVAWWPFVALGNATLYDLSGNNNNGVITNMAANPWLANEVLGGHSLDFDGANDQVNVTGNNLPTGSQTTFTMSAWANGSAGPDAIVIWGSQTANNGPHLYRIDASNWRFGIWDGVNIDIAAVSNVWTHLVATFDGTNGRFYRDGILTAGPTVMTSDPDTQTLRIASNLFDNVDNFLGQITDVRIYNRALSTAEAWQLFDPSTRWDLSYPLRQTIQPFAELPKFRTGGSGNSPIFRVRDSAYGRW